MKKKLRKHRRGGNRARVALDGIRANRQSNQLLLHYLITFYDGPRRASEALSEILGVTIGETMVTNWRLRGKLPLKYALRLAQFHNTDPRAFNYPDTVQALGNDSTWDKVVKTCKQFLTDEQIKEVLSYKWPV